MSGQHSRKAPHMTCAECQHRLQEYLDGGMSKPESMRVFLHLRDCNGCAEEMARLEQLVSLLEVLPEREPPADFDAKVLAAVPYDSYKAMAGLRQARVPVFLEKESLPAWVRSRSVRLSGASLAAIALAGQFTGILPSWSLMGLVGLAPEVTVALQGLGRRLVVAVKGTEA